MRQAELTIDPPVAVVEAAVRNESLPAPRRGLRRAGRYSGLVVAAVAVLFPIYVALTIALQPVEQGLNYPRALFVTEPVWGNFTDAFSQGHMGRYLLNSGIVAVAITAGQVLTSILAAYVFAFVPFRGRTTVFVLFMTTLMVPTEVIVIANYQTIRDLGWIDTYQALTVPFLATAFGTFLLRQAFLTVPRDLREAAELDGYGHLGFCWRVVVPLARSAIAALAVFGFLLAWNQYLWPLLVTNEDSLRTVQIGLKALSGGSADERGVVMAGTIIATLPIFALLLAFQRQLIRGLTSGAVKG